MAVARLSRVARYANTFTDLSFPQISALVSIAKHEPMTLQQLADHERITAPSMLKTVQSLIELGYITRRPHESDKRKQLLEVTKQGNAAIDDVRERRDAWMQDQLDHLTEEEIALLRAALPALQRLAGRHV